MADPLPFSRIIQALSNFFRLLRDRVLPIPKPCIECATVPKANGLYIYKTMFLRNIPVRVIDFSLAPEWTQHDAIVRLVTRILAAKAADPVADTSALEREIDRLVYELYGLTEEVAVVEGERAVW